MKQDNRSARVTLHRAPSRRMRSNTPVVKQNLHGTPDAYGNFVAETTQDVKDDFYLKLAGILLKRSQTSSDD